MTPLGLYLHKKKASKVEIYRKTNISENRIGQLWNNTSSRLYAEEFYLIVLAIDDDMNEAAKEVFKELHLTEIDNPKLPENGSQKKLTPLGRFLTTRINNNVILSKKTGIKEPRLSELFNDSNAGLLAKEVYLIALALKEEPGDVFLYLYQHLKLNTPEQQAVLKKQGAEKRGLRKKKN